MTASIAAYSPVELSALRSMLAGLTGEPVPSPVELAVRHVRTPEGAKMYGQPIGSIIVSDVDLPHFGKTGRLRPAAPATVHKVRVGKFEFKVPQGSKVYKSKRTGRHVAVLPSGQTRELGQDGRLNNLPVNPAQVDPESWDQVKTGDAAANVNKKSAHPAPKLVKEGAKASSGNVLVHGPDAAQWEVPDGSDVSTLKGDEVHQFKLVEYPDGTSHLLVRDSSGQGHAIPMDVSEEQISAWESSGQVHADPELPFDAPAAPNLPDNASPGNKPVTPGAVPKTPEVPVAADVPAVPEKSATPEAPNPIDHAAVAKKSNAATVEHPVISSKKGPVASVTQALNGAKISNHSEIKLPKFPSMAPGDHPSSAEDLWHLPHAARVKLPDGSVWTKNGKEHNNSYGWTSPDSPGAEYSDEGLFHAHGKDIEFDNYASGAAINTVGGNAAVSDFKAAKKSYAKIQDKMKNLDSWLKNIKVGDALDVESGPYQASDLAFLPDGYRIKVTAKPGKQKGLSSEVFYVKKNGDWYNTKNNMQLQKSSVEKFASDNVFSLDGTSEPSVPETPKAPVPESVKPEAPKTEVPKPPAPKFYIPDDSAPLDYKLETRHISYLGSSVDAEIPVDSTVVSHGPSGLMLVRSGKDSSLWAAIDPKSGQVKLATDMLPTYRQALTAKLNQTGKIHVVSTPESAKPKPPSKPAVPLYKAGTLITSHDHMAKAPENTIFEVSDWGGSTHQVQMQNGVLVDNEGYSFAVSTFNGLIKKGSVRVFSEPNKPRDRANLIAKETIASDKAKAQDPFSGIVSDPSELSKNLPGAVVADKNGDEFTRAADGFWESESGGELSDAALINKAGGSVRMVSEGKAPDVPKAAPDANPDAPKVTVGGVSVTESDLKDALLTLGQAKGMKVKQPLEEANNPLSGVDYKDIVAQYKKAHPGFAPKSKYAAKETFVAALKDQLGAAYKAAHPNEDINEDEIPAWQKALLPVSKGGDIPDDVFSSNPNMVNVLGLPPNAEDAIGKEVSPGVFDVGGVHVTPEQIQEAVQALVSAKGMKIKEPLSKIDSPLASANYHSVAEAHVAITSFESSSKNAKKEAFIAALQKKLDDIGFHKGTNPPAAQDAQAVVDASDEVKTRYMSHNGQKFAAQVPVSANVYYSEVHDSFLVSDKDGKLWGIAFGNDVPDDTELTQFAHVATLSKDAQISWQGFLDNEQNTLVSGHSVSAPHSIDAGKYLTKPGGNQYLLVYEGGSGSKGDQFGPIGEMLSPDEVKSMFDSGFSIPDKESKGQVLPRPNIPTNDFISSVEKAKKAGPGVYYTQEGKPLLTLNTDGTVKFPDGAVVPGTGQENEFNSSAVDGSGHSVVVTPEDSFAAVYGSWSSIKDLKSLQRSLNDPLSSVSLAGKDDALAEMQKLKVFPHVASFEAIAPEENGAWQQDVKLALAKMFGSVESQRSGPKVHKDGLTHDEHKDLLDNLDLGEKVVDGQGNVWTSNGPDEPMSGPHDATQEDVASSLDVVGVASKSPVPQSSLADNAKLQNAPTMNMFEDIQLNPGDSVLMGPNDKYIGILHADKTADEYSKGSGSAGWQHAGHKKAGEHAWSPELSFLEAKAKFGPDLSDVSGEDHPYVALGSLEKDLKGPLKIVPGISPDALAKALDAAPDHSLVTWDSNDWHKTHNGEWVAPNGTVLDSGSLSHALMSSGNYELTLSPPPAGSKYLDSNTPQLKSKFAKAAPGSVFIADMGDIKWTKTPDGKWKSTDLNETVDDAAMKDNVGSYNGGTLMPPMKSNPSISGPTHIGSVDEKEAWFLLNTSSIGDQVVDDKGDVWTRESGGQWRSTEFDISMNTDTMALNSIFSEEGFTYHKGGGAQHKEHKVGPVLHLDGSDESAGKSALEDALDGSYFLDVDEFLWVKSDGVWATHQDDTTIIKDTSWLAHTNFVLAGAQSSYGTLYNKSDVGPHTPPVKPGLIPDVIDKNNMSEAKSILDLMDTGSMLKAPNGEEWYKSPNGQWETESGNKLSSEFYEIIDKMGGSWTTYNSYLNVDALPKDLSTASHSDALHALMMENPGSVLSTPGGDWKKGTTYWSLDSGYVGLLLSSEVLAGHDDLTGWKLQSTGGSGPHADSQALDFEEPEDMLDALAGAPVSAIAIADDGVLWKKLDLDFWSGTDPVTGMNNAKSDFTLGITASESAKHWILYPKGLPDPAGDHELGDPDNYAHELGLLSGADVGSKLHSMGSDFKKESDGFWHFGIVKRSSHEILDIIGKNKQKVTLHSSNDKPSPAAVLAIATPDASLTKTPYSTYADTQKLNSVFLSGSKSELLNMMKGFVDEAGYKKVAAKNLSKMKISDLRAWSRAWLSGDFKKALELENAANGGNPIKTAAQHPGSLPNPPKYGAAVPGELPAGTQPPTIPAALYEKTKNDFYNLSSEDVDTYLLSSGMQNSAGLSFYEKRRWVQFHSKGDKLATDNLSLLAQQRVQLGDTHSDPITPDIPPVPVGESVTIDPAWAAFDPKAKIATNLDEFDANSYLLQVFSPKMGAWLSKAPLSSKQVMAQMHYLTTPDAGLSDGDKLKASARYEAMRKFMIGASASEYSKDPLVSFLDSHALADKKFKYSPTGPFDLKGSAAKVFVYEENDPTALTDPGAGRYLLKLPADNPNRPYVEHYAGEIGKMFGFSSPGSAIVEVEVPKFKHGEFAVRTDMMEKQLGQVQHLVANNGEIRDVALSDLTATQLSDVLREHLLDWVTGNDDAHGENFLMGKDGHVFGIDRGRAFGGNSLDFGAHSKPLSYAKALGGSGLMPGAQTSDGKIGAYYDQLYSAIVQHKLDKESVDKAYISVMSRAKSMQNVSSASYREMIEKVFEHQPATGQYAVAPGHMQKVIDAATGRKESLIDDFDGFWTKIYEKAGWEKPKPPKQVAKDVYGELTHEYLDQAKAGGLHGHSLLVSGNGIHDSYLNTTFVKDATGKEQVLSNGRLTPQGHAAFMDFLKSQGANIPTDSAPPTLTPAGGFPSSGDAHSSILPGAKNISKSSNIESGSFDELKISKAQGTADVLKSYLDKYLSDPEIVANESFAGDVGKASAYAKLASHYTSWWDSALKSKQDKVKPPQLTSFVYVPEPKTVTGVKPTLDIKMVPHTELSGKIVTAEDGAYSFEPGAWMSHGVNGTDYEITMPSGSKLRYLATEGGSASSRAHRFKLQSDDASGMNALQELMDLFHQAGVDVGDADEDSLELHYWRQLYRALQGRGDSGVGKQAVVQKAAVAAGLDGKNPKGSTSDEIAAWRSIWSQYKGPELVDKWVQTKGFLPRFDRMNPTSADGSGAPYWMRFDYDPDEFRKSYGKPLSISLKGIHGGTISDSAKTSATGEAYSTTVAKSGGRISSSYRIDHIGQTVGAAGESTSSDQAAGSGSYVFTRQTAMDNYNMFVDPAVLLRVSTYSHPGDGFGSKHQGSHSYSRDKDAKFDIEGVLGFGSSGNETLIKNGISVAGSTMLLSFESSQRRKEMIDYYKSLGITEIMGRPIEEVFILQSNRSSAINATNSFLKNWKKPND